MTLDDLDNGPFEVWPDNWHAVSVYCAMRTQWVVGPGGPVGLNYASLGEVWRRLKVPIDERDDTFRDLQVMEYAGLDLMHKKKD